MMTNEQRQASIERHMRFLTPAEQAVWEPSEAELIAAERRKNVDKKTGAWDRLRGEWAARAELYMEGR